MEKYKCLGSKFQYAEIIIDYKKGTTELIDVHKEELLERLYTAYISWLYNTPTFFYSILIAIIYLIYYRIVYASPEVYIIQIIIAQVLFILTFSFLTLPLLITLAHLNEKFDQYWKAKFAMKTGDIKRNKITLKNFTNNIFLLYNFKNIVLDFEAMGDVGNQLSKIHIKKEHRCSNIMHQADVKSFYYLPKYFFSYIWNAYFIFDKIPKDGELKLEWR